jgi:hypothetical protein
MSLAFLLSSRPIVAALTSGAMTRHKFQSKILKIYKNVK